MCHAIRHPCPKTATRPQHVVILTFTCHVRAIIYASTHLKHFRLKSKKPLMLNETYFSFGKLHISGMTST